MFNLLKRALGITALERRIEIVSCRPLGGGQENGYEKALPGQA